MSIQRTLVVSSGKRLKLQINLCEQTTSVIFQRVQVPHTPGEDPEVLASRKVAYRKENALTRGGPGAQTKVHQEVSRSHSSYGNEPA
jgi:hypothetical protein